MKLVNEKEQVVALDEKIEAEARRAKREARLAARHDAWMDAEADRKLDKVAEAMDLAAMGIRKYWRENVDISQMPPEEETLEAASRIAAALIMKGDV